MQNATSVDLVRGQVLSGTASSPVKRVLAGIIDRIAPGHRVRAAFRAQAGKCDQVGAPFSALLCRVASDRLDPGTKLGALLLGWPSHPGNDALPLRFAGALHALVLGGHAPRLAPLYPPSRMPSADELWKAVLATIDAHGDFIANMLASPPQTNETGRSAALLGGFLTVAATAGRPLFLSELGASAGLNLFWDRFSYAIGDASWGPADSPVRLAPRWTGALPPVGTPVSVVDRAGCDLNPLMAGDTEDRLRLLSYVWPDQPERLTRLRAALDIAAAEPPELSRADAADWLDARLAAQPDGTAHVVYHTIVWQYLPAPTRQRIAASIAAAGARGGSDRPVAWLRLEADGRSPGAALTLTEWPSGTTRTLARADFHGHWVEWTG